MNVQMIQIFSRCHINNLFHMTHIDNLKSIFNNGLLSHNNSLKKVDISNKEVNARRDKLEYIYGKNVHDYVPFYFNPRNAMMYRNKDENIVILAFDRELIFGDKVIYTDRNASTNSVLFYKDIKDIKNINWSILWSKSWYERPSEVKQIMMAEVLVPKRVSIKHLKAIVCKDILTQMKLKRKYPSIKVYVDKKQFFK